MAGIENLINKGFESRSTEEAQECGRRGGVASGIARRKKRERGEIMREMLQLGIKDPKMLKNLENMGIETTGATLETAASARVLIEILKKGNAADWQRIQDEVYGKQESKTEVEVSGGISGININVKKCDGGDE